MSPGVGSPLLRRGIPSPGPFHTFLYVSDPPSLPRRRGPRAAAALALLATAVLAGWLVSEKLEERRIAETLAPYAGAPLPQANEPVDTVLADVGQRLFRKRCSACHAITGESRVGPDLAGVTRRRELGWIRSMILAPDSMTVEDPVARELKGEYEVQMLTPRTFEAVHALALVEFLRQVDSQGGG